MATLDSSQPRRKRATYGKPSHKRVQGYSYDDVFAAPQRSQEHIWDVKDALYERNQRMASSRGQVVGSSTEARVHEARSAAIPTDQEQTALPLGKPKVTKRSRLRSPFDGRTSELASNTTSSIFDVPSSEEEIEAHKVTSKRTFPASQFSQKHTVLTASKQSDFGLSDTTESNELGSRSVSSAPKRRNVVALVSQQRSPVSLDEDDSLRKRIPLGTSDEYTTIPEIISSPPERRKCYKVVRSPGKTYARQTQPQRAVPPKPQEQVAKSLPPERRLESSANCAGDGIATERSKKYKGAALGSKPLKAKGMPTPGIPGYAISGRPTPEQISLSPHQILDGVVQSDRGGQTPALPIYNEKPKAELLLTATQNQNGPAAPRQAHRLKRLLTEDILTEDSPDNSRPANRGFSRYGPLDSEAAAPETQTQDLPRKRPRQRLIDSLAVDMHEFAPRKDSIDKDINIDDSDPVDSQTQLPVVETQDLAESQPPGDSQCSTKLPGTAVPIITNGPLVNQRGGPKITYARQRSFLTDDMLDGTSLFDAPLDVESGTHYPGGRRGARGGRPFPAQLQSLCQDQDTIDDANGGAIRSIHELREAGGNKRFLDEMESLFEDIEDRSTNSLSRRRSALLELGSKLAEKAFVRRFVENNLGQRLLVNLDVEHDVIVSTILASAIIFTMDDAVATHSVLKIHQEGAAQMLLRLLDSDRDISFTARERRTNMSKVAQSLVFGFRELIRNSSIWEVGPPHRISPRLIALRGLELIVRQLREEGAAGPVLPRETTEKIVQVLVPFSMWQSPNEPTVTDRVELELALSILESCAINMGSALDESVLAGQSLEIVSRILPAIWRWTEDNFKQMILLTLRLYLSITNNSPVICDVFAKPEVLNVLVGIVHSKFDCLSGHLEEEQRLYELDVLVLGLGLLINFAELSDIARLSVLSSDGDCLLEDLLRTFLERLEKAAEADSMEESQSNVAFGYLSVLLGSLCQNSDIRGRLRSKLPGGTLQPLAYAVDEFIQHHRKVDDLYDGESGSDSENGFTQRLQLVVDRLRQSEGLK